MGESNGKPTPPFIMYFGILWGAYRGFPCLSSPEWPLHVPQETSDQD